MNKLTTLCYIEKDNKYLMLHRIKKENDINHDKWIGVGGKFEWGESPEECMLREVREETGYTPTAFVYPFGAVSSESLPILKELGFQATLICESHINAITRDPECLYGLGRYRRPAKTGSEAFFKKILPKES